MSNCEQDNEWYTPDPNFAPIPEKEHFQYYDYYRAIWDSSTDHQTNLQNIGYMFHCAKEKGVISASSKASSVQIVADESGKYDDAVVKQKITHLIAKGYVEEVVIQDYPLQYEYKIASIEHFNEIHVEDNKKKKNAIKRIQRNRYHSQEAEKLIKMGRNEGFKQAIARKKYEKLELVACSVLGSVAVMALILAIQKLF